MVVVSAARTTEATSTLSDAVAVTCRTVPGAACNGALTLTTGFSVSGTPTIVTVAEAVPRLPAASRAVASTCTIVPGAIRSGTLTIRAYGEVGNSTGSVPLTVKVTDWTPTLSDASAVIVT